MTTTHRERFAEAIETHRQMLEVFEASAGDTVAAAAEMIVQSLRSDGTLYLCLGQEHRFEFLPLLRTGISDAELVEAVRHAITLKPERHEFRERPQQVVRFMAKTGG